MARIIEKSIDALIPDDKNFNKGTEFGDHLMDDSLRKFGLGRSILLDKNGNIIAGNKTQLAAIEAGITKVRVIETTGEELVAVKRTDLDLDSKKGREMALADNATSKLNLEWDEVELQSVTAELDIDVDSWLPKNDEVNVSTLDISDQLEHYHQVIVVCKSEDKMKELCEQLKQEGLKCNTLTL
jgi:precorrin-6B methylase 1